MAKFQARGAYKGGAYKKKRVIEIVTERLGCCEVVGEGFLSKLRYLEQTRCCVGCET